MGLWAKPFKPEFPYQHPLLINLATKPCKTYAVAARTKASVHVSRGLETLVELAKALHGLPAHCVIEIQQQAISECNKCKHDMPSYTASGPIQKQIFMHFVNKTNTPKVLNYDKLVKAVN